MLTSQPLPAVSARICSSAAASLIHAVVDESKFLAQREPVRARVDADDFARTKRAAEHRRSQADGTEAGDKQPVLPVDPSCA